MPHATDSSGNLRKRIVLIVNPTAGRRSKDLLDRVLARLAERGCVATVHETTGPDHVRRIAARADRRACDALVVAGGDGTINDAANGLHDASPPLGIVPLGTANVVARELDLPMDPDGLAGAIAAGPARAVWAAALDGRLFLQMAGVGFDAAVVKGIDLALKRRTGKAAYALKSLQLLLRYDYPAFDVTIDGRNARVASLILANGRYYAGRYLVAPRASLYEPQLQVLLFSRFGAMSVLSYGAALLAGRLPRHAGVTVVEGREIHINGPAGAPAQIDGDLGGRVPLIARAGAARIEVLHPADS